MQDFNLKNEKMKNLQISAFCLGMIMICFSCKKQDEFLNAKPTQSLTTISTISDIQKLLNNHIIFNNGVCPEWGDIMSDDMFIPDNYIQYLYPAQLNTYNFSSKIFSADDADGGWSRPYQVIYYCNTVLDALTNIKDNSNLLATAKGTALFYRSFMFYNLVQMYAMPYDSTKSAEELGIPLRLSSDFNLKVTRASEKECYGQILNDLISSASLLPDHSDNPTLPTKGTANALLARIYLAMGNYKLAFKFADASIQINGQLSDFNDFAGSPYFLTTSNRYPLVEDIFHVTLEPQLGYYSQCSVDPNLYDQYDQNDLRKSAYFVLANGYIRFKGSYELNRFGEIFSGLATDEMYLTRAEASARMGNVIDAMSDLNKLLLFRYKTGTFINKSASSGEDAIDQILIERRKELCFRGIRFQDLRRINKESNRQVTVVHTINGVDYKLIPNDPKYAMEIPIQETQLSGIQQNQR